MIYVNFIKNYHFWDKRKPKYWEKTPKNGMNTIGLFWPSHFLQEYVFLPNLKIIRKEIRPLNTNISSFENYYK